MRFRILRRDQLESVHVYGMSEYRLKYPATKCVNARFHAEIGSDYHLLPTLQILGPRLKEIHLSCEEILIDAGEWEGVWNLCFNLEVLNISYLRVEAIRAIMHTRNTGSKK